MKASPLKKLGKNASKSRAFNSTLAAGTKTLAKTGVLKKSRLKPMSAKTANIMPAYHALVNDLKERSRGYSELNGEYIGADWLDPHHILGRGKKLCDPFNIMLVSRAQHGEIEEERSPYSKEELLAKVKAIRVKQGFKINP
jgi:hypothetical protein